MRCSGSTFFALFVFLIVPVALRAAEPDATLRTDYKYAWPREDQLVLDALWQLAHTDVPETVALPEDLGELDWFETQLPTDVHWALYRAGKAGHPYVGLNTPAMRWVEDKAWWFRKKFAVPKNFEDKYVRLMVEGTDYHGHYWLNGKYLGRSEGAFGAAKMAAYSLRTTGENELVVRVECAGYKLGREGGVPHASLVKSELWSGWRVGAHDMNTVGIWLPLRLVATGWPCLERPFVRTTSLNDDSATVRTTVEVCSLEDLDADYDVAVSIRGKGFETPVQKATACVRPLSNMVLADLDVEVPQPQLWWPNGLGEQPMYEATITLSLDGEQVDRIVVPFGIRTIERRLAGTQRTDYAQKAWVFHVNGQPMFVKGTNWMPIDALADASPERYEWHLSMARDAGIQMIRVWGGGILEPNVFYELCDRYGIMVWQDFPLTCGWKASKIDRNLWKNTVMWTIFRLRNHPSLAFWCGGNEFPPDDPANSDLVGTLARYTRILDGTRPFMGASPDEGDYHAYPQWDASQCWDSQLVRGPFGSEWGSHGMPTAQTYREIVRAEESEAAIGPTLLKMDKKLMEERFPEIAYHWVEFIPSRLPQMLSRGSAYDDLATVPLERFTEAVAAGSAEFYKYSAEAARSGYPLNGGLLFWVWKRPWPIVGIQICDGFGQPLSVYYDVKRAYSSPWPCLVPPHLNYAPGDEVEMKTHIFSEVHRTDIEGARLTVRLLDPQLQERQVWNDRPSVNVPAGPQSVAGPTVRFTVPDDFARSFFFMAVELNDAAGNLLARNVYTFRCPPQLEDKAFREEYRREAKQGLQLTEGPWLRPQLLQLPTQLKAKVLSAERESEIRGRLTIEVENTGNLPAVMTNVHVAGPLRYVADDAFFWLEPGERRQVNLRLRLLTGESPSELNISARAWNCEPGCETEVVLPSS